MSTPAYEIKDYKRAKDQKMGYVYFSPDKSYYSVPYRCIGKKTLIHYTKRVVEVNYNHVPLALHQRDPGKGTYTTNTEHLSSTHKGYTSWPEYFKNKAAPHGANVVNCVGILIRQKNIKYFSEGL